LSFASKLESTDVLIGVSAPMQRVARQIQQVSAYGYPLLIAGERGSGKELAARTIHSLSPRKKKPFVALDCSSLGPTLLKAELFGYERGAFLGASGTKWGALALAGEGTLFLDQIAEISTGLQSELMRILQQSKFAPIGSTYPMPFKARVIAGNSGDLHARVKAGVFREDLYMALTVRRIDLSPLRERKADIPLLADYFFGKYRQAQQAEVTFSDSARRFLEAYDWPGNVRELENTIKRAAAGLTSPILRMRDVRLALRDETIETMAIPGNGLPPEEIERQAIVRALRNAAGDTTAAAHRLGMGRAALTKKLRLHGLSGPTV
jgi:DNA-binding NtrC family response regulator